MGLNSIMWVKCEHCCIQTKVPTDKIHVTKGYSTHADVNTRAVLGKFHEIKLHFICNA